MDHAATVTTESKLIAFLYHALLDGEISLEYLESKVSNLEPPFVLNNGFIASYAQEIARDLIGEGTI